jgi:DNA-binding HxlR family transcriptional regulator
MEQEKTPAYCAQRIKAFEDTRHILNRKWLMMIIGNLADGKKRYLELQREIAGIGPKMLTKELQELEINGLIARSEHQHKVEYELTEYGRSLKPIIDVMVQWGTAHRTRVIKEMSGK